MILRPARRFCGFYGPDDVAHRGIEPAGRIDLDDHQRGMTLGRIGEVAGHVVGSGSVPTERPIRCYAEGDRRSSAGTDQKGISAIRGQDRPNAGPAPDRRATRRSKAMSDHVYSLTEIVGSSKTTIEDAIQSGLHTAAASLRNLEWFEVTEIRGSIANGAVSHYQVSMKLGFRYEHDR
jgi:flavin-binding protein dodecin